MKTRISVLMAPLCTAMASWLIASSPAQDQVRIELKWTRS